MNKDRQRDAFSLVELLAVVAIGWGVRDGEVLSGVQMLMIGVVLGGVYTGEAFAGLLSLARRKGRLCRAADCGLSAGLVYYR